MCTSKPKTPKIEPPDPAPPPPVETATVIKESVPRTASQLASKRRGRSALVISREASSGLNGSPGSGLAL